MKIRARISESGTWVEAANDVDWLLVHPPDGGERPVLFCPDSTCPSKLVAKELPRSHGAVTRFFAFGPRSKCGHHEVKQGVPGQAASKIDVAETGEHHWLKRFVLEAAHRAGYVEADLERPLPVGVRADVFVPGAQRSRVEVQRGATDVPARSERYPDVVWLLRAAFDEANKKFLFDYPCVQVRVTRKDAGGRWVPARPWSEETPNISISASSTVLRPRVCTDRSHRHGFFETKPMSLDLFLRQVWSGERQWFRRGTVHTFAGWVLGHDLRRYEAWLAEREAAAREVEARAATYRDMLAAPEVCDMGSAPPPPEASPEPYAASSAPEPEAAASTGAASDYRAEQENSPKRTPGALPPPRGTQVTGGTEKPGLWARVIRWFNAQ